MSHLAGYYAKKGDRQKSIEWLGRSRSLEPNNVELIYEGALVHALDNHRDEALANLREAFQKGASPEQARHEPEFKNLQGRQFDNLLAEFGTKKE